MDWLDPADDDRARRDLALGWLEVQRRFAWRPEKAPGSLREDWDPAPALRTRPHWKLPAPVPDDRMLDALARSGVRLLPIASPLYPERLARLSDAPPLLAIRGTLALLRARCVAIVGARACTAYGRNVASRLAEALARSGVVVVSGLARGIDGVSHDGALRAGGATIAFQACGIDQVYPRAHVGLAHRIASSGAIVSELPVATAPLAHHFPLRNRLISALSEALVVVEARAKGGSLVTARHAADQGVDVLAVPGPVDAPASAGTLRLIQDGAGLVTGAADVLAALGIGGAQEDAASSPPLPPGLPGRILGRLRHEPCAPEPLARELGCSTAALLGAVSTLELDGLVVRERDGRLRAGRPGRIGQSGPEC